MKKIFLFLTPDGVTYSSPKRLYPDVDNLQVLGYGEGDDEEDALKNCIQNNKWVFDTDFDAVFCVEIKGKISPRKRYFLKDFAEIFLKGCVRKK